MSSAAILRRSATLEAFRITTEDTNRMALIADPIRDGVPFTAIVEIFDAHGRTPPNTHAEAYELFFVLAGRGIAICDGERMDVGPGDSFVVKPGHEHVVENPNGERLYCLTVMVPNEGFAELIQAGVPDCLDARDLAVLGASR
jgi:mannose-6-phosphate isomerase-like protein (cupin superfamily)